MLPLIGTVLVASLLGSPHCAVMCGPFACFAAGQTAGGRRARAPMAGYHAGRLTAYLLLGALAGAAGTGLNRLGGLAGVGRGAAIVAGTVMVLWGALTIARALGARLPGAGAPPGLRRLLAATVARFDGTPPLRRGVALGLATTLLPCGWLYAFVATAAATGSARTGALVMAVFWLGTLPVLASMGLAAQRGLGPLRRRLPVVTAAALVVLGLLTIAGRIAIAPDLRSAHAAHAGR